MIKALIIEDEPRNVALLEELIKINCGNLVEIMGHAGTIKNAVALIQNVKPELVYLDIELNDGNAFELLEMLDNLDFAMIFITAFNEYAIKAFRLNAVDYLLKPISSTELKNATFKAIDKIKNLSNNENILKVISELRNNHTNKKIGLPVADGIIFITPDTIIRIEAKGNYSIIFLATEKKITCTKTLKEIESLLPGNTFLRIHHSWVINTNYIKKYYRGKNGYIEMEDGSTVAVSTRKKEKLISFFNGDI